jgi:tripartite-type tricarboxylate transporter receptor subunit TctC
MSAMSRPSCGTRVSAGNAQCRPGAGRLSCALATAAVSIALLIVPLGANADPADFYRGKTVEVLVGFSPGGGYDAYARVLARSLGNHIPGKPQVVVKNFTGAGSLRLARFLQDAAPRDGLSFGTFDTALLISPLLKDGVNLEPAKLSWIGTIATDLQVCVMWHASRAKSVEDLRKVDTVFGATGRDDIRYISTDVLRKVVGANIKIVPGYPGTSDIRLALEKSEIDGECETYQSLKSTRQDWLNDRKVNTFIQFGEQRDPELPNVPLLLDYARSPTEREALKLIFSSGEAGRPYAGPPGIPADRLDTLRHAFDATMKDSEFLSVAQKQNLDVDPKPGEKTEEYLRRSYASPPAVIELARKLLSD